MALHQLSCLNVFFFVRLRKQLYLSFICRRFEKNDKLRKRTALVFRNMYKCTKKDGEKSREDTAKERIPVVQ
jgi:hypothetical protein